MIDNDRCMACRRESSHHLHEINRGSMRQQSYGEPATWLALCFSCHAAMDLYSDWPVAKQLALKLVADPVNFDLHKINVIRRGSHGQVAIGDVAHYLQLISGKEPNA